MRHAPLLILLALLHSACGHDVPAGQAPLASLTPETLPTLGKAFNGAKDDVRVVALLSPT